MDSGSSGKAHVGLVAACLPLLLSLSVFLAGCSDYTSIAIKMEAIRFTPQAISGGAAEAVSLSLWMYDENAGLIKHAFASGKLVPDIQKTDWKSLNDTDQKAVPRKWLKKSDLFTFQIKLNPNRLLTPPDAVFSESIDLGPLIRGEIQQQNLVIPSGNKLFELRIGFFASTSQPAS